MSSTLFPQSNRHKVGPPRTELPRKRDHNEQSADTPFGSESSVWIEPPIGLSGITIDNIRPEIRSPAKSDHNAQAQLRRARDEAKRMQSDNLEPGELLAGLTTMPVMKPEQTTEYIDRWGTSHSIPAPIAALMTAHKDTPIHAPTPARHSAARNPSGTLPFTETIIILSITPVSATGHSNTPHVGR